MAGVVSGRSNPGASCSGPRGPEIRTAEADRRFRTLSANSSVPTPLNASMLLCRRWRPRGQQSAVDDICASCAVARFIAGQKKHEVGYFGGARVAAHRDGSGPGVHYVLWGLLAFRQLIVEAAHHPRIGQPRMDRIYSYIKLSAFKGCSSHHAHNSMFTCSISTGVLNCRQSLDGRCQYYAPAAPALQMRESCAHSKPRAAHVDGCDLIKHFDGIFRQRQQIAQYAGI